MYSLALEMCLPLTLQTYADLLLWGVVVVRDANLETPLDLQSHGQRYLPWNQFTYLHVGWSGYQGMSGKG